MISQNFEVTESDCCGNGCANCILDVKPIKIKSEDTTRKHNVILNYCKFHLQSKVEIVTKVLHLHFVCNNNLLKTADYILDIPAGKHVMMRTRFDGNAATKYMLRPYSPYWVDDTNMEFKILVNLKPNGYMSQFIGSLAEGDEVEFRGPIGSSFVHNPLTPQCIFLITQGVAIAPTIPLIEELLANEDDSSRIYHFACFQNLDHVYFRERLKDFNKFWNFNGRIYLSNQKCESHSCVDQGCSQHCVNFLSRLAYKEPVFTHRFKVSELEDIARNIGDLDKVIIVCGTKQFQDYIIQAVKNMKIAVSDSNIYKF